MRRIRSRRTAVGVVVAGLACAVYAWSVIGAFAGPTTGPTAAAGEYGADTSTVHFSSPFFLDFNSPCAGGNFFRLSGRVEGVTHVTTDASGVPGESARVHIIEEFHVFATGVDATGATYRAVGASTQAVENFDIPVGGRSEATEIFTERFVGPGPGNNFTARLLLHETVNANGDVTASVQSTTLECR